jgi:hypothetical protein
MGLSLSSRETEEDLYITGSTGFIGIGTKTPTANLHIYRAGQPPESDSLYGNVILDTDSTTNFQRIRFDVGVTPYWGLTRIGTSNNFAISGRIGSTWSDAVFVIQQSSGYVGINTTSPASLLQLVGSGTSDQGLFITTTGTGNDFYAIKVGTGTSTDVFAVTNAGRVGIGTTSPSEKLHIKSGIVYIDGEGSGLIIDSSDKRVGFMKYSGREAGIWRSGSQDFEIGRVTAGTLQNPVSYSIDLYVANDGNVGIGTTSPNAKLEVNGNIYITSNTNFLLFGTNSAVNPYIQGASDNSLYIGNNNTSRIFISGSGNVGIGTTSPSSLLSLSKSSLVDFQFNASDQGTDEKNWIWQAGSAVGTGVYRLRAVNDAYTNGVNAIIFTRSGISSITTTFTGGNVGIGTTSPATRLQISGVNNDLYGQLRILATGTGADAQISFETPSNGRGIYVDDSDTNKMKFYTGAGKGTGDMVTFDNTGNIGIGTTSPTSMLTLRGTSPFIRIERDGVPTWQIQNNFLFNQNGFSINNVTAGTTPMFIGENGNVGIGTTGPATKLHTVGYYTSDAGGNGVEGGYYLGNSNHGLRRPGSSSNDVYLYTTSGTVYIGAAGPSSTHITVLTGGNVGIGTTAPGFTLDVLGAISLRTTSNSNVVSATYGTIQIYRQSNTIGNGVGIAFGMWNSSNANAETAYLGTIITTNTAGAELGDLAFYTTNNGGVRNERMRITSGGSVGIGTSGAGTRLTVLTDASRLPATAAFAATNVAQLTLVGSDGGLEMFSQDDNTTWGHYLTMKRFNGSTGALIAGFGFSTFTNTGSPGSNTFDRMGIHYGTNAYPQDNTELMSIKSNGTVGIGTINPNIYSNGFNNQFTVSTTSGYANISVAGSSGNGGGIDFGNQTVRQAGVYSLNGSHLGFYTNGSNSGNGLSERMRIISNGNVGIGTTIPSSSLHVVGPNGGADPFALIRINATGTYPNNIAGLAFDNSGVQQHIRFLKNGTEKFQMRYNEGSSETNKFNYYSFITGTDFVTFDANTGNVGIGTTSPSAKFNINNSGGTGNTFYVDAGNAPDNQVLFEHSGGNTPVPFTIRKSGYSGTSDNFGVLYIDMAHSVATGGSNLHFTLRNSNGAVTEYGGLGAVITTNTAGNMAGALNFYTTNAGSTRLIRMRVAADGNVGIGSTSPAYKLDVNGTSYFTGTMGINGEGNGLTVDTGYGNNGRVGLMKYGGLEGMLVAGNTTTLRLGHRTDSDNVATSGTPTIRVDLFIATNGSVGIGSNSPAYKLDVTGTIRATGDVIAYSDARVKENVETVENALSKVVSLRGVTYTRKDSKDKSRKLGVIAQEVLEVLPEVVIQDPENGNYNVAYGNIVGVLIEAIKELKAEIDELKNNKK